MLKVQAKSALSIPAQLRTIITEEIARGAYGETGKLPSERSLTDRFAVSRTSVRECLNALVKDGVLVRIVGKGTYVAAVADTVPAEPADGQLAFLIGENIFQFVQPGYSRILVGAEQACRQQGYKLLFHSVGEEENGLDLDHAGIQPDGIRGCLVAGGLRRKTLDRLLNWDIPVVLTDLIVQDGDASAVGPDYTIGTRQAIEHLAALGHESVGFIGFPNSEKYRTFWATLETLGLRYNPHFVRFLQLPDVEPGILAGFRAMQELLASPSLPTAVLATNDLVAMGLMEALKMANISVPGQISVIGYDELGRDGNPPLTTIRSYPEEVGRIAAKMLMDQITGKSTPQQIAVPTELVVRGTTAPCRVPTGGSQAK